MYSMHFGSLVIAAILLAFWYQVCRGFPLFSYTAYMFFGIAILGAITTGKDLEFVFVTGLFSVVSWMAVRREEKQYPSLKERYKKIDVSVSRNANQTNKSKASSDFSGDLPNYELEHHKQQAEQLDNHNVQSDPAERIRKWREQTVLDIKKRIEIETKTIREHQEQGRHGFVPQPSDSPSSQAGVSRPSGPR